MIAYHFTSNTLRDGSLIPPKDKWLIHEGPLVMCKSGLHASKEPFDALQYAPGNLLHKVRLGGEIITDDDKVVAQKRKIAATIDAESLLRELARKCALDVLHLWEAPAVVRKYLETGNENLMDAAWAAAWAASRAASRDAARAAAWAAASAAWATARDAARAAARAAQRKRFNQMVKQAFKEAA